ncbi:MAG: Rossmann-like and DUF2520 domain-containing protein [Anaerovoracaceae bacterium]|jgi:predicted short-subunit dehydrogenase-like oxidoreductase (DUF2520 family)
MKTGFIGAGKAGTSLGVYFNKHGIPVCGYFSRTEDSSKKAADLTESTAFTDIKRLVTESDMIFITTPDGVIGRMAQQLSQFDLDGKYLCHISGSLGSGVLSCATERCASAHPMIAMSGRNTDLSQAFFTMEGDAQTMAELEKLFAVCGNRTARIPSEKKPEYHCAASVASNLMVGLAAMAVDMLSDCGFSKPAALELISPLMRGNIDAVCEKGPAGALTGPLERADEETISKHLASLDGRQREIYRLLSLELTKVAREKNIDRNYSKIIDLLEEKK